MSTHNRRRPFGGDPDGATKAAMKMLNGRGGCACCGRPAIGRVRVFVPQMDILQDSTMLAFMLAVHGRKMPTVEHENGQKYVKMSESVYCKDCLPIAERQVAKGPSHYWVAIERAPGAIPVTVAPGGLATA